MPKHVLIFRRLVAVVALDALPCGGVELAGGVPDGGLVLGGLIAVPFLRVQVQQFGAFHFFQLSEQPYNLHHVVSVSGSEIANVQSFEDVLLMAKCRFHGIAKSNQSLPAPFLEHSLLFQPACRTEAQAVVGFAGIEIQQVLLHATHRTVDRHIVVVEDDEQVVGRRRGVVQAFKSKTARHGAIANDGHDVAFLIPFKTCGYSHAQSGGDAI